MDSMEVAVAIAVAVETGGEEISSFVPYLR